MPVMTILSRTAALPVRLVDMRAHQKMCFRSFRPTRIIDWISLRTALDLLVDDLVVVVGIAVEAQRLAEVDAVLGRVRQIGKNGGSGIDRERPARRAAWRAASS